MQIDITSESRASWSKWATFLRRHGLENLAVWALEASGPLATLGAQVLYLGGPLLQPALSTRQIDSLAGLLENQDETRAFIAFLQEDGTA